MGWFKNAVTRAINELNAKAARQVQEHEIYSASSRSYQIWEIENGFLVVDYGKPDPNGFIGSSRTGAVFYPDLKSLYEGLVTSRTQEKLGMDKAVPTPAYPVTTGSSFGAAGTVTNPTYQTTP